MIYLKSLNILYFDTNQVVATSTENFCQGDLRNRASGIPGAIHFAKREDYGDDLLDSDEEFATAVNAQLARSKRKHVYIYVSDKDKAPGFVFWLTRRERLGQVIDENKFSPAAKLVLAEN